MSQARVALVLGGSGDIGSAAARELAGQGCDLAIVGRDRQALDLLADTIAQETGVQVHAVAADLREEASAPSIVDEVLKRFGRIDVLVGTAGEFRQGTLQQLSSEDWTDGFAAMFFGTVRMVKAAWPHLAARRGHVVLVAGIFAIRPRANGMLASSIAAALLNFSKSAAEQGLRDGVSVNAVLPGPVAGRRYALQVARFAQAQGISADDAPQAYARMLGVDRPAQPHEVARAIGYLASASNDYVRGASLVVDGGISRAL